jgi:hypothetical protein
MDSRIALLMARMRELEGELELEWARRSAELRLTFDGKRARFEEGVLAHHRMMKTRLFRYIADARPLTILSAPVIYALIVPIALLDLAVSIYQAVCFPIYGIAKVRRGDYLTFDRGRLAYLNAIEKINCAYCSYANGVIAYAHEIAARTEQYWCPIKHARRTLGHHDRYAGFTAYGDADAYRRELDELRRKLGEIPGP